MPQIKSAKKRVIITETKTAENKAMKSKISTYSKKFKLAIANKDINVAEVAYKDVESILDTAVKTGVIHKNSANRKKATFAKMLDECKKA